MDEVNKSGPYFEAVSLCYFNGSDSLWRWTRVADIENGELTTFWYNPLFRLKQHYIQRQDKVY